MEYIFEWNIILQFKLLEEIQNKFYYYLLTLLKFLIVQVTSRIISLFLVLILLSFFY